ncbi:MAG: hypothetical protein R3C24_12815 [Cyanobacteriota/Melainabacteria group bacterium]
MSSFQKEINSLSKGEQLQFVRDLSTDSFNNNFLEDGKRVYMARTPITKQVTLVDLDLVIEDRQRDQEREEQKSRPLYPGRIGESLRQSTQKIDQTLRPYANLFGLMNEYDYLSERYSPQMSKTFGEGELSRKHRQKQGEVRALLEKKGNLEAILIIEAILKAFRNSGKTSRTRFSPVNSTDSMLARLSDNPEMPTNMWPCSRPYFQRVEELRLLEPDRDDEFKRYE